LENNRINRAFAEVKAEDCLKEGTLAFLEKEARRRDGTAQKLRPSRASRKLRRRGLPVTRFAVGFACALLLSLGGLFAYQDYFTATGYVDIDVNPSIELTLNRYGRVIDASAYNDDGTDLLTRVPLKNKNYTDALRLLIDEMTTLGYLQNTELFSLTVQTDGGNQEELLSRLRAILSSLLTDGQQGPEQDVFAVDTATKSASHDLHLSPAKYLAIQELQTVDPTATFENCRDHSISEIREQTHLHMRGGHDATDSGTHEHEGENDNGGGSGVGNAAGGSGGGEHSGASSASEHSGAGSAGEHSGAGSVGEHQRGGSVGEHQGGGGSESKHTGSSLR
jgi:hypothetical protein